VGEDKLKGGG
jgi:hypothetical protein